MDKTDGIPRFLEFLLLLGIYFFRERVEVTFGGQLMWRRGITADQLVLRARDVTNGLAYVGSLN
jgi:hypothetical protein